MVQVEAGSKAKHELHQRVEIENELMKFGGHDSLFILNVSLQGIVCELPQSSVEKDLKCREYGRSSDMGCLPRANTTKVIDLCIFVRPTGV